MARPKADANGSKPAPELTEAAAGSALADLDKTLKEFQDKVAILRDLHKAGNFKYLSKKSRNELLMRLIEGSSEIKDASVGTFRVLKKVKRQRVPDKLVDGALTTLSKLPEPQAASQ